jgi:hypothetical protein
MAKIHTIFLIISILIWIIKKEKITEYQQYICITLLALYTITQPIRLWYSYWVYTQKERYVRKEIYEQNKQIRKYQKRKKLLKLLKDKENLSSVNL